MRPVSGSRPLLHRPHLLGVGSHLSLLHDLAEEFHGGGVEHALLGLNKEPVLQQSLEDQADVSSMFLRGPGKNKDIIKVHYNKQVKVVPQNVIYQGLEDGRGVLQPERHDEVFKVPQVGVKSRLPFVPLSDMNQVVRVMQVELSEHHGVRKGFKSGAKEWNGVFILNSYLVK